MMDIKVLAGRVRSKAVALLGDGKAQEVWRRIEALEAADTLADLVVTLETPINASR